MKRRQRETSQTTAQQKDPLLNYKRSQLVARVREEMVRRVEAETQYRLLLEERVQSDLKIMQLEAELARFQSFLGHLRDQVRFEEQQGGKA
jgi:hypothetical protein